jgi:hypothetical protein
MDLAEQAGGVALSKRRAAEYVARLEVFRYHVNRMVARAERREAARDEKRRQAEQAAAHNKAEATTACEGEKEAGQKPIFPGSSNFWISPSAEETPDKEKEAQANSVTVHSGRSDAPHIGDCGDSQSGPLLQRQPIRLALPRSVDVGEVRQSFSHGRSRLVTVEVRNKRVVIPGPARTAITLDPPKLGASAQSATVQETKRGAFANARAEEAETRPRAEDTQARCGAEEDAGRLAAEEPERPKAEENGRRAVERLAARRAIKEAKRQKRLAAARRKAANDEKRQRDAMTAREDASWIARRKFQAFRALELARGTYSLARLA